MKKFAVLLVAFMLSFSFCLSASAVESPIDLNKKGSLSLTMSCSHGYRCGGNIALYYVAEFKWTGHSFILQYTDHFENCPLPLNSITDKMAAEDYKNYVIANEIVVDRNILYDGETVFEDIPLGLYLVIHEEPSEGFTTALPFLVTVPMSHGDYWEYNVDATPKVELEHFGEMIPPGIPQTGQLKWPIPVLAVCGVVVFGFGWFLCFKRGKNQ